MREDPGCVLGRTAVKTWGQMLDEQGTAGRLICDSPSQATTTHCRTLDD